MALKTVLKRINKAREEYEAAMKEAGADLSKQIAESLAAALRLCPEEYVQVQWTQYTPSFNDGDPCRFSVGDIYAQTEEHAEDNDEGHWYHEGYSYNSKNGLVVRPPRNVELKPLDEAWDLVGDEDVLERAFGDGSRITVRRDGTYSIDDYYCGY